MEPERGEGEGASRKERKNPVTRGGGSVRVEGSAGGGLFDRRLGFEFVVFRFDSAGFDGCCPFLCLIEREGLIDKGRAWMVDLPARGSSIPVSPFHSIPFDSVPRHRRRLNFVLFDRRASSWHTSLPLLLSSPLCSSLMSRPLQWIPGV